MEKAGSSCARYMRVLVWPSTVTLTSIAAAFRFTASGLPGLKRNAVIRQAGQL